MMGWRAGQLSLLSSPQVRTDFPCTTSQYRNLWMFSVFGMDFCHCSMRLPTGVQCISPTESARTVVHLCFGRRPCLHFGVSLCAFLAHSALENQTGRFADWVLHELDFFPTFSHLAQRFLLFPRIRIPWRVSPKGECRSWPKKTTFASLCGLLPRGEFVEFVESWTHV